MMVLYFCRAATNNFTTILCRYSVGGMLMVNLIMGLDDMTQLPLDLTPTVDPMTLTMVSPLAAINFEHLLYLKTYREIGA